MRLSQFEGGTVGGKAKGRAPDLLHVYRAGRMGRSYAECELIPISIEPVDSRTRIDVGRPGRRLQVIGRRVVATGDRDERLARGFLVECAGSLGIKVGALLRV